MIEQRPNAGTQLAAEKGRRRWHFSKAILDESSLELRIEGVPTDLERKPLEVLIHLLQHAGEVCTKDELLASVWPGRVLSETVLTKCVGRLREVLGDQEQDIIKTAYGFGYRFVAPVRVESAPAIAAARFDFRPGDRPPNRPLWTLIERLGVGGHGEAWRGRHEKTHEQRVFKFALDESSLGALKREITLFRIINDTLGENARVVKLLDWNLEQLPYFVEAEHIPGGSLLDWAHARGGLSNIPMSERLEAIAKIAAALAAVHSVGVLHKDLKPSNVLVRTQSGTGCEMLLADFGSGGVLDVTQLERLGITRMGFTRTLAAAELSSGTPLYLAPEILSGQPFTVKADLYALGVILYQTVAGDFTKVMSPGWEREIEDELLREDISSLAEGNPAVRLADASQVAHRLRTLRERREELCAKREAEERAERARRLLERVRARRVGVAIAFIALSIGLATSSVLYLQAREAQRRMSIAAAQSKAVTEYLSKDVFAPVSSGAEPVKDLSVTELLVRAGNQIDARFATQPEVACQLHYVMGRSLNELYETGPAVLHFNRALELCRRYQGTGSEFVLRSAAELVNLDYVLGHLRETITGYRGTLEAGRDTLGPESPSVLKLRQQLALGQYLLGQWQASAAELTSLLAITPAPAPGSAEFVGHTELYLGQALLALAKPMEAGTHLRHAIDALSEGLGPRHPDVSEARDWLGLALGKGGLYDEAREQLTRAEESAVQWAPATTWTVVRPRFFLAQVLLEANQPHSAQATFAEIVSLQDRLAGAHPDLDHTGPVRQALAETYLLEGDIDDAIQTLRKALEASARADGPEHPVTVSIRSSLVEALLAGGHAEEAKSIFAATALTSLDSLPPVHPFRAQLQRVRGILALQNGDMSGAEMSLRNSLDIYRALYGTSHWRTIRARQELAVAAPR